MGLQSDHMPVKEQAGVGVDTGPASVAPLRQLVRGLRMASGQWHLVWELLGPFGVP